MGPSSPVAFVDPRTIVLLTGVMGGLMAVALFFLRRHYPASLRGLSHWSGVTAVLFMAWEMPWVSNADFWSGAAKASAPKA